MRRILHATFWILVYLSLALGPLFVLLLGPTRPGRGFWTEFSVALGFAGLAMMGLQFLLTARYRPLTSPYGIDVVYHFHRQISLVAFALILAHPSILFITRPGTIAQLNIFTANWTARFGVLAVLVLALLIFTSIYRLNIRLNYEPWRISHGILATAAVTLAMAHVVGIGYQIDTIWKRAIWLTLGMVWIGSLLYIRVVKPLNMLRRPYVVDEVRPERGKTWSVAMRPDGHKGLEFKPGQFAWLTIWSSPFSVQEHPFSFSSSAVYPQRFEIAVKELGDFTARVKNITPGTRVYLDGPYGVFTIDDNPAPGYVFLAGGIGITPIMSMLRTLADRRDMRPAILIYGCKTWDEATFRDEIDDLKDRLNLKVVYVLEQAPDGWEGERGFVTPELMARCLPENRMDLQYFICGPELMLDAVERGLQKMGISLEKSHAERFNLV